MTIAEKGTDEYSNVILATGGLMAALWMAPGKLSAELVRDDNGDATPALLIWFPFLKSAYRVEVSRVVDG